MDSSTGSVTPFPLCATTVDLSGGLADRPPQEKAAGMSGETLLHNVHDLHRDLHGDIQGDLQSARSLMSILGFYCDLLAMPGVLQPRHRKYAEDLRLVRTRVEALIGRLMGQLSPRPPDVPAPEGLEPEGRMPARAAHEEDVPAPEGSGSAPHRGALPLPESSIPAWLRVPPLAEAPCKDLEAAPLSLRRISAPAAGRGASC
jgi:hypothetical protein